jgi:hypothetical protein
MLGVGQFGASGTRLRHNVPSTGRVAGQKKTPRLPVKNRGGKGVIAAKRLELSSYVVRWQNNKMVVWLSRPMRANHTAIVLVGVKSAYHYLPIHLIRS